MRSYVSYFFIIFLFSFCVSNQKKSSDSYLIELSKKIEKNPYNTDLLLKRIDFNKSRGHLESAIFRKGSYFRALLCKFLCFKRNNGSKNGPPKEIT